ncbi:MAG: hypothetical protein KDM63_13175 [Verrucomicrobiae bacterium]|nr:hypothetical protein [Verrucomicrobiae bacterium]
MSLLTRYYTNPFASPRVPRDRLMAFATDHYPRLVRHNPDGALDDRITATQAAIAAADEAISADLTLHAARIGSKLAKTRFRRALPAQVDRVHSFIRAVFGSRSPETRACGPLKTYRRCPDDELDNRLATLLAIATKHQAQIGDFAVQLAADLVSGWAAVYQKSESATTERDHAGATLRAALSQLQWELFANLLRLIELHRGDPKQLPLYMQTHLLRRHRSRKTDPDAPADHTGSDRRPDPV